MKKNIYGLATIVFIISGSYLFGTSFWIGGDTIPNQYLLDYILNSATHVTTQWGLPGPSAGFALWSQIPYALVFNLLYAIYGSYSDGIILGLFLVIFIYGWQKLFFYHSSSRMIAYLLAFFLLASPYTWLLVNRNVLFQLVLIASVPYILISIRSVIEQSNIKSWSILTLTMILSSAGWLNPAYLIPAIFLILIYICIYFDIGKIHKKFIIIGIIGICTGLPTILGLYNLATNSKNLISDHWNNIVLTQIPLDRQKTQNTLDNIIAGYNGDTKYAIYGYMDGLEYQPWWFTKYTDDWISLVGYIPFLFLILCFILIGGKKNKDIYIWGAFIIFLLFMMKSSSGPGGQYFYDAMMNSGIMKMFRSPHIKFGFEYMAVICFIIAITYSYIESHLLKKSIIGGLLIYTSVFFIYPVLSREYIPPMQVTHSIPAEYTSATNYLRSHPEYKLGMLLPFNESTWDSNSWGYEGYHILHWMNTGVSFWNRNGLSFNADNLVSFDAGKLIENYDVRGIYMLKKQGYKVLIYDTSSSRDERFHQKENHLENIRWLNEQQSIRKVFTENYISIYEIL